MKRRRSGFTLIEVALFLAITGILFVGIAVGTQNSIFQQRFNDAVQSFAEYLRTAYSEVTNVRNESLGRSDQAIYGKLITFGENHDLAGSEIQAGSAIFSYNVIGRIDEGSGIDALGALASLGANVVVHEDGEYKPVGFADDYKPKWASAIQKTDGFGSFVGALLIVRHPDSGTVYTFVKDNGTIQVNDAIRQANEGGSSEAINPLISSLNDGSFEMKAVDFCVNPNGIDQDGLRRDVKIVRNAKNATGIEIIGDDADICKRAED